MGRSEFDYLPPRPAWNAGRKVGAKRPLKPRQIWAIRFHLDREHRLRDRALFDLAIDSKLRGCDLVKIKIGDLVAGGELRTRAMVMTDHGKLLRGREAFRRPAYGLTKRSVMRSLSPMAS